MQSSKDNEPKGTNSPEQYYHNTQLLLRNYRCAVWNLEMELSQICDSYPMNTDGSLEDKLFYMEEAGASYYGSHLQRQASNARMTWQMIQYIDKSLSLIRHKHYDGELYYLILYYSYIAPEKHYTLLEQLDLLQHHGIYLSRRSFYRRRKEAVCLLGSVLWGYTSKECFQALKQYLDQ